MPIPAVCSCGTKYKVNDSLAGKAAKCKKCGSVFKIPVPQAEDLDDILSISQADAILPGQAPLNKKRAVRPKEPDAKKRCPADEAHEAAKSNEMESTDKGYVSIYDVPSHEQRLARHAEENPRRRGPNHIARDIFFIIIGLVILCCSPYVYAFYAAGGGTGRTLIIIAIGYWIGGKIGATLVFVLLGLGALVAGILSLTGIIEFETEDD